jgi:lambda family phage minor tail protein L
MSNLFLLNNNEVLDFYEIHLSDYEGYLYFHGSKNFNTDLIFQGKKYLYIPCEMSNLEYNSEGKTNRPTFSISNINNFMSNLMKDRNDFIGRRFYRKKILAKDLDPENFGGVDKNLLGARSFSSFIASDMYVIQKKSSESREKIEILLTNVLDFEGVTIPSRKVFNNACQWTYRGCGCNYGKINGYSGPDVYLRQTLNDDLSTINTNLGLSSNLTYHFQSTGQTFSGTVKTTLESNPSVILTYDKLTAWSNGGTAGGNITLAGNPKKYVNEGRMGNYNGILLSNRTGQVDSLTITTSNLSSNLTIFYVSEMVSVINDKTSKKNTYRGLSSTQNGNFLLGYWNYNEDVMASKIDASTYNWVKNAGPWAPYNRNKSRVYGAICPTNSNTTTYFIRDGNILTEKIGFINSPNGLGFNILEPSEIVVYEIIIYNTLLTLEQADYISFYLANKYNLPIPFTKSKTVVKKGSEFFSGGENLGLPVADENNKLFLIANAANTQLTNSETYGLNSLSYKGDYSRRTKYSFGDFVKIEPPINFDFNETFQINNNTVPARFFVCIDLNGSINEHPFNFTNKWKEDKCSKNLNGCSLRFNGNQIGIPFGGFPGTVQYEYKLPA